jgi:hypothetical protein
MYIYPCMYTWQSEIQRREQAEANDVVIEERLQQVQKQNQDIQVWCTSYMYTFMYVCMLGDARVGCLLHMICGRACVRVFIDGAYLGCLFLEHASTHKNTLHTFVTRAMKQCCAPLMKQVLTCSHMHPHSVANATHTQIFTCIRTPTGSC